MQEDASVHRLSPAARDPMARAGERLRLQYLRHHNSAPFWTAYQCIQAELIADFPDESLQLCNVMASIAQRLGALDTAHIIHPPEAHDAASTRS